MSVDIVLSTDFSVRCGECACLISLFQTFTTTSLETVTSASFLAEASVRSPRKLFIFII